MVKNYLRYIILSYNEQKLSFTVPLMEQHETTVILSSSSLWLTKVEKVDVRMRKAFIENMPWPVCAP